MLYKIYTNFEWHSLTSVILSIIILYDIQRNPSMPRTANIGEFAASWLASQGYTTHRVIGSASVNSVVYLAGGRGKGNAMALSDIVKFSTLASVGQQLFFDNKVAVHQQLGSLSRVDRAVAEVASVAKRWEVHQGIGVIVEDYLPTYMDFEQFCLARAAASDEDIVQIFRNIVRALVVLGKYGFNHNDLHMRNILVNSGDLHVKLIDFDWSTFHDPRSGAQTGQRHRCCMYSGDQNEGSCSAAGSINEAQQRMMKTMYFNWFARSVPWAPPCPRDKRELEKHIEYHREVTQPCDMLHFFIHMHFSYLNYVYGDMSTTVDLAKLVLDFGKKFMGRFGPCHKYDTEFDERDIAVRQRRLSWGSPSGAVFSLIESFMHAGFDIYTVDGVPMREEHSGTDPMDVNANSRSRGVSRGMSKGMSRLDVNHNVDVDMLNAVPSPRSRTPGLQPTRFHS
jgi:hypothetical protein